MAAELASAEYAFLIILKAEGRELSNTEMDNLYHVRLIRPAYEKLNAYGLVSSNTTHRPFRHTITESGLKMLAEPLAIDDDSVDQEEKRSTREKQLWAAVVAQQNEILRLRASATGAATVATEPAELDDRIRAAYAELAGAPGELVSLAALRRHLHDVSKAELDGALARMLDADDVRLEPDQLKHRISAEDRRAAIHVSGEDRHKLAIGRP